MKFLKKILCWCKTNALMIYYKLEEPPLGYIPTEETIATMDLEDQELYQETKNKILGVCQEEGMEFVPIDLMCKGFNDIEKQYSFKKMCELWQYGYVVNLLAERQLNLEFNH